MATIVYGDFEWDDEKAASNAVKHVDTLAMSSVGRILYVVSTEAGPRLRIISARRATAHERRIYADQT